MRKEDRYTQIQFDDFNNLACIITYNNKLKNKIETFAAEYPQLCAKTKESADGCVTYSVVKDRLGINFIKPYSAERKARMREVGLAHTDNLKYQGWQYFGSKWRQ